MVPAVRHALLTTLLIVGVCGVVGTASWSQWTQARDSVADLTARASGTVVAVDGNSVEVRWQAPGRAERIEEVALAGAPPEIGSAMPIAYSPDDHTRFLVPGSAGLAAADRALADAALAGVVLTGVVLITGYREIRGRSAGRRPVRHVAGRHVRFGSGLLQRSWLETEETPQRWIPVRFDPALMTMAAPTVLTLYGDPRRDRWVGAEVDDRPIRPSGRVRHTEPPGRRTDDPLRPDESATRRAARTGLARHLRTDLSLTTPAPFVGLLWAYVVDGGIVSFVAVTGIAAAVGLWSGALRGSDPS